MAYLPPQAQWGNVTITGGAVDGTTIGGTTPAAGTFSAANINNATTNAVAQLRSTLSTGSSNVRLISDTNVIVTNFEAINSGAAGNSLTTTPLSTVLLSGVSAPGGLILLSTNTTAPMIFGTGGTATTNERMRITAAGNVGIGTTSPSSSTSLDVAGPVRAGSYAVASLPAGVEGALAYATNGRKQGQGAGSGTGVPVYYSAGAWRRYSDDTAVAA